MADDARGLRLIAAELADLDLEDVQAILADLPGPARARMAGLIAGFKSGVVAPVAPEPAGVGYSAWVEARLSRKNPAGQLTDRTREALRGLAAETSWSGGPPSKPTRRRGFAAILGRGR